MTDGLIVRGRPKSSYVRPSLGDKLMSMVVKEDCGCWRFTGAIGSHGYGYFCWDDKTRLAHRASWEVHRGPIPRGMFVCHRCDNPVCCNPDHLFIGAAKARQGMEDISAITVADLLGKTPASISPKPPKPPEQPGFVSYRRR
jgi:hypothetical protein